MTRQGTAAAVLAFMLSGCALSPGSCGAPPEAVTWAKEPAMLRPITYWRRVERGVAELKASCAEGSDPSAAAAAWGVCYNAYVLRNYLGSIHALSRNPDIAQLSQVMATSTEISTGSHPASSAPSRFEALDSLTEGIAKEAPEIFRRPIEHHALARGGSKPAGHAR